MAELVRPGCATEAIVLFALRIEILESLGIAKVDREHFPDPTAQDGDWSAVELKPLKALKAPVTLDQIKRDPVLKEMLLVRHTRLSTMPVSTEQAARLLELGGTRI